MMVDQGVFAQIAAMAQQRDAHGADLSVEIGLLHGAGAIAGALPAALSGVAGWADDPLAITALLERTGAASLPLGRLFEGHVNAAQLVALYGTPALQASVTRQVQAGALLGVWGADSADPVALEPVSDAWRLSGRKIFCSGLGLVTVALISAQHDGRTQLVAIDATTQDRFDPSQWCVSGMRATASGAFDVDGVMVTADALLGRPDDYYREPWFLGGMYRMCAVQCGGLNALISAFIAHARRRAPADTALLHYRVGSLLTLAQLARDSTHQLASAIAAGADADSIARQAVLAREGVEHCIVESLAIVQRAAGTSVHSEPAALSRIARDLSLYIRQGAIDTRLIQAGAFAMACASDS